MAPADKRPVVVGVGTAAAGAAAVLAGIGAVAGQTSSLAVPWVLPLAGFRVAIDPLRGVFVAITGALAVVAAVFGIGYARRGLGGWVAQVFVAATLLGAGGRTVWVRSWWAGG